jgi:hypothetical protein
LQAAPRTPHIDPLTGDTYFTYGTVGPGKVAATWCNGTCT